MGVIREFFHEVLLILRVHDSFHLLAFDDSRGWVLEVYIGVLNYLDLFSSPFIYLSTGVQLFSPRCHHISWIIGEAQFNTNVGSLSQVFAIQTVFLINLSDKLSIPTYLLHNGTKTLLVKTLYSI